MTQAELEQFMVVALAPIAEALAELAKRIDSVEPAAAVVARATVGELIAAALLDIQRAQNELRECAYRCERSADSLRAQCAESNLALERRMATLRDGKDGVDGVDGIGIRSLEQTEDLRSAEFEFTNDERHVFRLPSGPRGEKGDTGIGIDAPAWTAGVYRSGTVVQHFEGRTYRANADTADEPGDSPAWQRLGLQGQRWCGPLDATRKYEAGDLYVDGGTFVVLASGVRRCLAAKPLAPSEVRSICGKQVDDVQAAFRKAHNALAEEFTRLHESVQSQVSEHYKLLEIVDAISNAVLKSNQRVDQLTVDMQQLSVLVEKRGGRTP